MNGENKTIVRVERVQTHSRIIVEAIEGENQRLWLRTFSPVTEMTRVEVLVMVEALTEWLVVK